MKRDSERPRVQIPTPEQDRPGWTRVGVVVAIFFVIGIALPRLAKIRLGPLPPTDSPKSKTAKAKVKKLAPAPLVPAPSASSGLKPVKVQTVVVKRTESITCRDDHNKVVEDCDRPGFDAILMPKIKQLDKCPSAAGLAGKLSIGFEVRFSRNKIRALRGKSSTIPHSTVNGIWSCVTSNLKGIKPEGIAHKYNRYTVYYAAYFFPPGKVIDKDMKDDKPVGPAPVASGKADKKDDGASGEATVIGTARIVYDTALVRDEPKTGKVVGRLVRGTKVQILKKKGSWYTIRFRDRVGWIYRGALAQ